MTNYDIIAAIESRALKNIGIFGQAGSGKSKLLSWFCWQYSDLTECLRYEIMPVKVFAFSYKRFQKGNGDFERLGFEHIDISKHLPNLFNSEYLEDLIRSFAVVFVSEISKKGLMASMLEDSFRDILEYKQCKSWDDFQRNAEAISKNSSGLTQNVAEIVARRVRSLNVGVVSEINFQFDKSMILDFAYLSNELAKNLYSEFYARLIFRKSVEESIAGRPHSIMLALDECHRLLRFGDISIISELLREGRVHMRIAIASQNTSDVNKSLFHFQWLQSGTVNDDDLKHIKEVDELHKEAVKKLNEKEFVWVNDGTSIKVPIFKLDIERLEEFREQHPQQYNVEVEVKQEPQETKQAEPEKSLDYTSQVLKVLGKSDVAMYGYQIGITIGLSSDDAIKIRQTLRKLVKDSKLRVVKIQFRKKEIEYYYIPNTEQVHNVMIKGDGKEKGTTKELLSYGWAIKFQASHGTHGYDYLMEKNGKEIIVEIETGSKSTLDDFNSKVEKYDKPVIIVIPNKEQKERYSYLPCVQNGKAKIALIPEIETTLKEFEK
jgi:hypothetical protein